MRTKRLTTNTECHYRRSNYDEFKLYCISLAWAWLQKIYPAVCTSISKVWPKHWKLLDTTEPLRLTCEVFDSRFKYQDVGFQVSQITSSFIELEFGILFYATYKCGNRMKKRLFYYSVFVCRKALTSVEIQYGGSLSWMCVFGWFISPESYKLYMLQTYFFQTWRNFDNFQCNEW